ncbi:MAG: restriction endonuclease subunit S, partial [Chloroflexaceae bacterium]|nr:restriction endonuclease subunit S [Chloroflexaceae bacterium]
MTPPTPPTVPPGYKQTEIGVIPEDWEVKRLGEIGSFSRGRGIKRDDC